MKNVIHVENNVRWIANILNVRNNVQKYVIENHAIKNVTKNLNVVVIAWDFVEKFVLKFVKLMNMILNLLIKTLFIIN